MQFRVLFTTHVKRKRFTSNLFLMFYFTKGFGFVINCNLSSVLTSYVIFRLDAMEIVTFDPPEILLSLFLILKLNCKLRNLNVSLVFFSFVAQVKVGWKVFFRSVKTYSVFVFAS